MLKQRTNNVLTLIITAISFLLPASIAAQDASLQKPQILPKAQAEYSADCEITIGGKQLKQKVYYTPGKERRDMKKDGSDETVIIRSDKRVSWALLPEHKMYMEMNVMKGRIRMDDILSYYMAELTPAGEELVDGIQTSKSSITITDPRGKAYEGSIWMTKENIVIKMDTVSKGPGTSDRISLVLSNLKTEKQDPNLFELPANYVKTFILPGGSDLRMDMLKNP